MLIILKKFIILGFNACRSVGLYKNSLLVLLFFIFYFNLINLYSQDDAGSFYQKGVDSKSLGERETNFEKALKLYLEVHLALKEKGQENGYLYFNIGNCYYNLNQLGEAILYYKQALKYLPTDEKLLRNHEIACSKRVSFVDIESDNKLIETLLFFHFSFTQLTKILLALILSLFVLGFFISSIILKKNSLKRFSYLSAFLYFIFLFSLALNYYYPNKEGVLIKDSFVLQDAGENYVSLIDKPYGIGSSIRVISSKGGLV
jgi:tetratricopeptide (TPR) repeat protein